MGASHLGGPVEEARSATLQEKLLVVCDAALGESPWVLDPAQREYWVIIKHREPTNENGSTD